jgi:phytoene dehydrogenase-like protein
MKRYDAIVIGSGIGGLVGAALLASGGLKTLVIEKHETPGGYLSSFSRKGFIFDSVVDCISGVEPGGVIHRALELLGVAEDIRFLRVDPIRISRFPDFDIAVDSDVKAYRDRLAVLFPSESTSIRLFFEKIGSAYSQFNSAVQSLISGGFALKALAPETLRLMDRSYGELLDESFHDYRLKAALADRCPFIGLPPEKVSAAAIISMMMSYFELGAYRPEGGFQRLADIFVGGIKRHGGDVIFGNGVEQILLDDRNSCRGVRLCNGEEYEAGYVISNADFGLTFSSLLGGKYKQTADEMMSRTGLSTSFFILYAGVEGDLNTHSSLGYYPSYDMGGFFDSGMEFREDSTIGVTVATKEDKSRAPQGFNTVVFHEMVRATGRKLDKAICIDRILNKADIIFPGIKDRITAIEAATPSTLERYTGNCMGAAFGWRQVPGFRGPGRHGIRNLSIAGHWGDFGGGVLAAAYSGAKAAGEILAMEGIKNVL